MATVNRLELLAALDAVRGAVAEKNFLPILTHVLVDGASVLGYDAEIGVKVKLPSSTGCTFNVKFDTFYGLCRSLSGESLELEVHGRKSISIRCGGHASKLSQLEEEFPKPGLKPGKWIAVPAGFREALERALAAAGEETDAATTGVLISGPRLYSTDRTRVVRCTLEGLDCPEIVLPQKAVKELIRLGNPTRLCVGQGNNMAAFDYANLLFVARLREGAQSYPRVAFDGLFQGRESSEPVPEGLVEALERLRLFVPKDAPNVHVAAGGLGLELATAGETRSATELLRQPAAELGEKDFDLTKLLEGLRYADGIDWGQSTSDPIYLRGEVAGFEFLLATVRAT